jgi:hypothetical protein
MVQLCLCGNSHTNLRVPFYQGLSIPPLQVLSVNQGAKMPPPYRVKLVQALRRQRSEKDQNSD